MSHTAYLRDVVKYDNISVQSQVNIRQASVVIWCTAEGQLFLLDVSHCVI